MLIGTSQAMLESEANPLSAYYFCPHGGLVQKGLLKITLGSSESTLGPFSKLFVPPTPFSRREIGFKDPF